MCGFAGFHSPRDSIAAADAVVHKMGERLKHRGPDDHGKWIDPVLGVALAFRRLAIMDLSELGNQPMVSSDGRFVLAFNGEVYNHRIIRAELEQQGHRFRGQSDTEVLLAGVSTWGLEPTLKRCIGMFAFALVDTIEKRLHLVRDRMGEKPLYYGWNAGQFFFGSELKAFRPYPGFTPVVDRAALTLYMRFGYVPAPHCILAGFHKLLPGHMLSLPLDGSAAPGKESAVPYWTLPLPAAETAFPGSLDDCVEHLDELLRDSIRMQMLADVPVGAFLSGGIDSSTVVSVMQAEATSQVKTFTIGFPDGHLDESRYAESIARHLQTDHTTWFCTDSELLDLAMHLPRVYCEPFADDSQLPTLALARLARQQVVVSLSGDGGDELFHGYGRYQKSVYRWEQLKNTPAIGAAWRCGIVSCSAALSLLADCSFKRKWLTQLNRARCQWLPPSLSAFYRYRMSVHKSPELYLSEPKDADDLFDHVGEMPNLRQDSSLLSYLDLLTYLPDDLLVKVDRATMAFGLEGRSPMLDHRVVEFATRIPPAVKRHGDRAKWPLRAILARRVPPALTERPKMGFITPLSRWLRGPLRDWAEDHLSENRLRQGGLFNPREVRRLWSQHQQGRDRALKLWGVLMFLAWHDTF